MRLPHSAAASPLLLPVWLAQAQDVTGAGATFPVPHLRQVGRRLQQGHRRAHQLPVGRLGRRHQADQGEDRRLRRVRHAAEADEELAKAGLMQFPAIIGGVVPVVNIEGSSRASSSSPAACSPTSTSARSRSGTTRRSPTLNPGVKLPDADITVVRRADGSGTTFIFTNYLSKVNAEWKAKVGEGTAVNWPTGVGGKGNEGVAAYVQRIRARSATSSTPTPSRTRWRTRCCRTRTASSSRPTTRPSRPRPPAPTGTRRFYQILTDQPGKDGWPITGATFILMHKAQDKPQKAADVAEVLRLGLQERRQDGGRSRLRAAARRGQGAGRASSGAQIKDGVGQGRSR